MKHFVFACVLVGACTALSSVARAEDGGGRPFVGVDVGVMAPLTDLHDYVEVGGSASPFVGYMFNDYIGIMGEAQFWGGKSKGIGCSTPGNGVVCGNGKPPRKGGDVGYIISDDNTTWGFAGLAGPRFAVPFGPVEIYATGQGGIATALAAEAITDTSPAVSAGGGINYFVNDNLSVGAFTRWNRYYQRVHHRDAGQITPAAVFDTNNDGNDNGDAQFITAGLGLTYEFREAAPPPPAPVVAQAPPPPPPPTPRPTAKRLVLRGVNFDFDKSNIRADARPVLDEAIATLKAEGGVAVIAEGHTDSKGTDAYNQRLSERRAKSVKDYLVRGGIPASRIRTVGYGESRPVASNDTEDGRAQNRRVELRIAQ